MESNIYIYARLRIDRLQLCSEFRLLHDVDQSTDLHERVQVFSR